MPEYLLFVLISELVRWTAIGARENPFCVLEFITVNPLLTPPPGDVFISNTFEVGRGA